MPWRIQRATLEQGNIGYYDPITWAKFVHKYRGEAMHNKKVFCLKQLIIVINCQQLPITEANLREANL